MYHHESASLGRHNSPDRKAHFEYEVGLMRKRWGEAARQRSVLQSEPLARRTVISRWRIRRALRNFPRSASPDRAAHHFRCATCGRPSNSPTNRCEWRRQSSRRETRVPSERPFDDPAFGQGFESGRAGSLHDLQFPRSGAPDDECRLLACVSAIRKDPLDEGKHASRPCMVDIVNETGA